MKKSTTIIIVLIVLIASIVAGACVAMKRLGVEIIPKEDTQVVLFEKNYYNTKLVGRETIHIISTGCKISYKTRYDYYVSECIEKYTEEINANIGEYFKKYEVEDFAKEDFCAQAEEDTRAMINDLFNEKLGNDVPNEYVTDVVFFGLVYQ